MAIEPIETSTAQDDSLEQGITTPLPPAGEDRLLTVENVSKAFDEKVVLRDVSMHVDKGETLCVLGKSGTGKSVMLKLIVRLLEPDSGVVTYRGKDVSTLKETELLKFRKHIGFLFQGGALFDSMTVGENLDLFLSKHTDMGSEEREKKILTALDMVGLADVLDSMPSELSGGMRKRAGLARAIVLEPELILYDEPTTGLDPVTAASIAELILTLQQRLGIASVVVTHDLPTAFTVADRAIVLSNGYRVYDGSIEDLNKSDDAFLTKYLSASKLDRTRRDRILAQRKKVRDQKDQAPKEQQGSLKQEVLQQ
jgi:phospholipid/cholesterol/gamma-HCH transport system ATP-binding protein